MSTPENSHPELQQLEEAREFLNEVFPEALLIMPALLSEAVAERLEQAGFSMAEVVLEDASTQFATYVTRRTPIVEATETIWLHEQEGTLPAGSHNSAMDSVVSGEFQHEWGRYLP